jgi:hypothetical protein
MKRHERKRIRETGQHYWWKPGQTSPQRNPNLEKAIGQ